MAKSDPATLHVLPPDGAIHFPRRPLWLHLRNTPLATFLSLPLIYGCAIPLVLLDFSVSVYQAVCFPWYGVPKVPRSKYFVYDRGKLPYLNAIEKLGCLYCSYGNGLLAYITEIAARTEQHFCPIRHARRLAKEHSRYGKFLPYGDAEAYHTRGEQVACDFGDLKKR